LLYASYMEATFDSSSLDQQLSSLPEVSEEPQPPATDRSEHKRGKPAFSPKTKGGIFGFKK
jgi:hypothetical protein